MIQIETYKENSMICESLSVALGLVIKMIDLNDWICDSNTLELNGKHLSL